MDATEPGEPTQADLEREFGSQWVIFTNVSRLKYGRRLLTSPPVVLRGEDWLDLRDQIRGYLGRTP